MRTSVRTERAYDTEESYMSRSYSVSVGSARDYEDLIAEIIFPSKLGIIISQEEAPGEYYISFHPFNPSAADDFDLTKYKPEACVRLGEVLSAISDGKRELDSQIKLRPKGGPS